jgi:osmotically inducible protein OsmC
MTARNGSAVWQGDIESGSGAIKVGDGFFEGAYSYQSRLGDADGTKPEQLVAAALAALAGCFTTGVTALLSAAGHPPESLHTAARVQLRNIDGAPTLTGVDLDLEGELQGKGD